jgi:hypothetical protein
MQHARWVCCFMVHGRNAQMYANSLPRLFRRKEDSVSKNTDDLCFVSR